MASLTRRQLASYASSEILKGNTSVVSKLAAYLVESRRTKEVNALVRDIESALMERGVVVADVASAFMLDSPQRQNITKLIMEKFDADDVQLREEVNPRLLGGVKVRTADSVLDESLRRSINQLKAVKV